MANCVYLTSPPSSLPQFCSMAARPLAPEDDDDFELGVQAAFGCLRDKKRPHARMFRALSCVPWMSKSSLLARFKILDFKRSKMGRPPVLSTKEETAVYDFVKDQHDIGRPIGRNCLSKKLTLLAKKLGNPTKEFTRARGIIRFLKRNGAKVVLGQKTDLARYFASTGETIGRFGDNSELASKDVKPPNTWVADECGFAAEAHDRRVSLRISHLQALRAPLTPSQSIPP